MAKSAPTRKTQPQRDHVDLMVDQWEREVAGADSLQFSVMARLKRAGTYVNDRIADAASDVGLTVNDLLVMNALRRAGAPYSLTPAELLDTLMVTPSAITKRIDRLVEFGLVIREADLQDGRAQRIRLTPNGRKLTDKTTPLQGPHKLDVAFAALTRSELRTLSDLLRKFLVPLEQ